MHKLAMYMQYIFIYAKYAIKLSSTVNISEYTFYLVIQFSKGCVTVRLVLCLFIII